MKTNLQANPCGPTRLLKNALFIFFFVISIQNAAAQAPSISSFSPAAGPYGSPVVINGANFSSTPTDNIVYFGAVRATVTLASSNALTVTVPAGASYQPISITRNGLTAIAQNPFIVTFTGGSAFTATSFAAKIDSTTLNDPFDALLADMDGDGKPDIITESNTQSQLSIYRNNGTLPGMVSFASPVNLPTGTQPYNIGYRDMDGDGKIDLITANSVDNTISILRNNSSPGNIFFDQKTDFPTADNPRYIATADFDGDGKPDIAAFNYGNSALTVSIFKNTSVNGFISFNIKADFPVGYSSYVLAAADMDGDGKPDLVVANRTAATFSVLRNTSTGGDISFSAKTDFTTGSPSRCLVVGDLNNDNLPDVAVANYDVNTVSVFKNTSTSGNINFNPKTDYPTATTPRSVSIGDLNGDGKADIVVSNSGSGSASVYNNTSTAGNITFAAKTDYATGAGARSAVVGDVDGGGVPDLMVVNQTARTISILRNVMIEPHISSSSIIAGSCGLLGSTIKITGKNFTGATSVKLNNQNAPGFIVVSDSVITATVNVNELLTIAVSTPKGSSAFIYKAIAAVPPSIISFDPVSGIPGTAITIVGANFCNVTQIKIGGVSVQSFLIKSIDTIIAVAGQGTTGIITLKTATDSINSASTFSFPTPTISSFNPGSGVKNDLITISGTGFNYVTQVYFSTVAAQSFTIINATTITARVGEGATGFISVTTDFGTSAKSATWFTIAAIPAITSVSPTSGNIGTTVTINGTNFSTIPAENNVYFGSAKATIIAATANQLKVLVPVGYSYQPISVTVNKLAATTVLPFTVTFGTSTLSAASFSANFPVYSGTFPWFFSIADIDGDNKPDMAVPNANSKRLILARNTSTLNSMSFNDTITIPTHPDASPRSVRLSDLNGDNKPDIILANSGGNTTPLSIYKNISTPGKMAFGPVMNFVSGTQLIASNLYDAAINDLDKDGKPDIVVLNNGYSSISIFRNTSTDDNITFAPKADKVFSGGEAMASGDLNGDGKADIVLANTSLGSVTVFRNLSTAGNITLDNAQLFSVGDAGAGTVGLTIADFDGDGKLDIAAVNKNIASVTFLRNTSIGATISFAEKVTILTPTLSGFPWDIVADDLNGDGRPDIAITDLVKSVSVLQNNSTAGLIAFGGPIHYTTGEQPYCVRIADVNLDGRPDLLTSNSLYNTILVYPNVVDGPSQACVSGNTVFTMPATGTTYQWQVDAGSGFQNISNNSNYSGATANNLAITNIPSAWNEYQYRCLVDAVPGKTFTLKIVNTWTGAVSSAWENAANWSCGSVPEANTDVIINSGTIVVTAAAIIRSIRLSPNATLTVQPTGSLTITH